MKKSALIARITLIDSPGGKPPRGHRYNIRGARRSYSLQWNEKYKEAIIDGRDWDLSDDNERAEFERINEDISCQSHEYYFPVIRFTAEASGKESSLNGIRFSPALKRFANERQIKIEDCAPYLIPTGRNNSATRADLERAEMSRQARMNQIEQRVDPKGQDALGSGVVAQTQLVSGIAERDRSGRVMGIQSPLPYGAPAPVVEDISMEELLEHTKKPKAEDKEELEPVEA